ncbi:hypothetical protein [Rudaeicoccus suwonensis]|uniref:DUF732 domain-containing protein n=1 Tax=Rudaeicoccus suwonensis TaxID=657409 RepID=A0A561E8V1_9MICO|nr:hypothetical protein [Rudaeicoccus suwonensis]TWE12042.1 hypothetical protein BKA23_0838 [Rudaeicoccus suwonensis]
MSTSARTKVTVAAALLAVPTLLTGCGGGFGHAAAGTPSSAGTPVPSVTPSQGDESPGVNNQGKPSPAAVTNGLSDYLASKGVPQRLVSGAISCVITKGYDDLSAQTLIALRDHNLKGISPLDSATLAKDTGECLIGGPASTQSNDQTSGT